MIVFFSFFPWRNRNSVKTPSQSPPVRKSLYIFRLLVFHFRIIKRLSILQVLKDICMYYFFVFVFFKVFEGVYNNSRMLHFLTAVVVSFGMK